MLMATDKPNVIIIHTDEHNFRTLGCYRELMTDDQAYVWGKEAVVETPNIDLIAKEGVLLTSFYANTPVCGPSRATLISGQYPQNVNVWENDLPMLDGVESFAKPMVDAGYATGYAGKWHLDGTGKPQWEPERQFGFSDNTYMFNRGHWKKLDEDENGPYVAGVNNSGNPNYDLDGADSLTFTTDFLMDRTMTFVKEHKDEPFCYMVSIPDPHGPNTVREPYNDMFDDVSVAKPATASKSADGLPVWGAKASSTINNSGLKVYLGMVKCIDDNVGELIALLKAENLWDNTILIFMSDHGDLLGEHKRDNKGVPYEGSSKAPFIIRYPEALKSGAVVDEAMSMVDFKPTLLSIMGLDLVKQEGVDASALLVKDNAGVTLDGKAFMRGTGAKNTEKWVGVFTDRYKLIYDTTSEPWLIDLEEDPDELVNYFKDDSYSYTISELALALKSYGEEYNDKRLANTKIAGEVEAAILTATAKQMNKNEDFLLFPNPSCGHTISIKGLTKSVKVEVYDMLGKQMLSAMTSSDVDVSDLSKGMYTMRINDQSNLNFILN